MRGRADDIALLIIKQDQVVRLNKSLYVVAIRMSIVDELSIPIQVDLNKAVW